MDINFHYYTIKTLARLAGFDDGSAQRIAHFSQYVDNYIMSSPFITDEEPPDFFMRNGLAHKITTHFWALFPCSTGINVLSSVSHNYQLHTLMPFHFIMPAPYNTVRRNADRSNYRCVAVCDKDNQLISHLAEVAANNVNTKDNRTLTALGIALHTFADTYSHCFYSGFHGWENESTVAKMTHNKTSKSAMNMGEITFCSALPSIGHGNVGHAPDICDCSIEIKGKESRDGALKIIIKRNNAEFFSDCTKRIFALLCRANKQPFPEEREWQKLRQKLFDAHNAEASNDRAMKEVWKKAFPDISYAYNKNQFFQVCLEMFESSGMSFDRLGADEQAITDMYSENGDMARTGSLTRVRELNEDFFIFNELAYRQVYAATGEYISEGGAALLDSYRNMAVNLL